MAKKKKKKSIATTIPVVEQIDPNMQKFIKISITEVILTFVLFIIGYNLSSNYQNIYFLIITILNSLIFAFVAKKLYNKFAEGIGVAFASMCVLITFLNVYNTLDAQFNWSVNRAYSVAEKNIEQFDKLYSTKETSLYLDKENMRLYSVTDTGASKYFYETNASVASQSEYGTLYGDGIMVKSQDNEVTALAIHPTTISTLTDYEQLIEFEYKDETYLAPTFMMGNIKWEDDTFVEVAEVNFGTDSAQNYKIYRKEESFMIDNLVSTFITPYKNVPYDEESLFSTRYADYMKSFNPNFELDSTLTFGVSKTLEVEDEKISRITFYYEIYNQEDVGGLLMEIVYKDNTADVCYIKEMYAENLTSAVGKGG